MRNAWGERKKNTQKAFIYVHLVEVRQSIWLYLCLWFWFIACSTQLNYEKYRISAKMTHVTRVTKPNLQPSPTIPLNIVYRCRNATAMPSIADFFFVGTSRALCANTGSFVSVWRQKNRKNHWIFKWSSSFILWATFDNCEQSTIFIFTSFSGQVTGRMRVYVYLSTFSCWST